MIDSVTRLDGAHEALAIVSLLSMVIGVASVLMQAATHYPVRLGPSLTFRTAFVVVFARIAARTIHGGTLTYWAVALYAAPGIACSYGMIDAWWYGRRTPKR